MAADAAAAVGWAAAAAGPAVVKRGIQVKCKCLAFMPPGGRRTAHLIRLGSGGLLVELHAGFLVVVALVGRQVLVTAGSTSTAGTADVGQHDGGTSERALQKEGGRKKTAPVKMCLYNLSGEFVYAKMYDVKNVLSPTPRNTFACIVAFRMGIRNVDDQSDRNQQY